MVKFSFNQMLIVYLFIFSNQLVAKAQAGKNFDRAIIVVFENTNYAEAMKQPFLKKLAASGANFTNFMALTHPSQGNYIALTSGSLGGVKDDNPIDLNVNNIVDSLEAKGLTWAVYAEDYPGNCFTGKSSGQYVRKHNPFISYTNIQKNPVRCARIFNANQFDTDYKNSNLPNYVFFIPNMRNDGHDTGVTFADKWYATKFGPYINDPNFLKNTVLISTFDESGKKSEKNQIYTSIIGPSVKIGTYSEIVTIYSLLKLIEDNWSLSPLSQEDAQAVPISNIWN